MRYHFVILFDIRYGLASDGLPGFDRTDECLDIHTISHRIFHGEVPTVQGSTLNRHLWDVAKLMEEARLRVDRG